MRRVVASASGGTPSTSYGESESGLSGMGSLSICDHETTAGNREIALRADRPRRTPRACRPPAPSLARPDDRPQQPARDELPRRGSELVPQLAGVDAEQLGDGVA